jgi:hypothetical protein
MAAEPRSPTAHVSGVYLGFTVTAAFAHDQALGEIAARLNELIDCDGSRAYSVPLNDRLIEGTMTSTSRLWKFQTQVNASDWGSSPIVRSLQEGGYIVRRCSVLCSICSEPAVKELRIGKSRGT